MEKLKFRLKQAPAFLVVLILIAVTLFTGVATIVKASKGIVSKEEISVPDVKSSDENDDAEVVSGETEEDVDFEEVEARTALGSNSIKTPTPTLGLQNSSSVSATVDTSGRCIITVFGKSYDVTPLQTTHPGGNVFVCGADNTSAYQSAHGTNVSRLSPYLVTASGSASGTSSSSSTGTSFEDGESERELEEEKKEFEQALEEAKRRLEEEHEDDN